MSQSKFTLIGCSAVLLWGTSVPFARRCVEDLGPYTTATTVFAINGILGAFVLRRLHGAPNPSIFKRKEFWQRIALFSCNIIFFYLALGTAKRSEMPTVIFLNYLWPSLTIFFSLLLFPRAIKAPLLVCGTLLVLSGIATELLGVEVFHVISGFEWRSILPFAAALSGAICWGFCSALLRHWGDAAGGSRAVPYAMLLGALLVSPIPFLLGETSRLTNEIILPLVYLSFTPLLGNLAWDLGMRKGNVIILSLVADMLPWISLVFCSVYLGVGITQSTWIAAVFIVAGAIISRFALYTKPNHVELRVLNLKNAMQEPSVSDQFEAEEARLNPKIERSV